MHYRIDEGSRDRGDDRRYSNGRDQYRDHNDDGDSDDLGDGDGYESGRYDGITDTASSVQGCHGSDTDMEKKMMKRSRGTAADGHAHIHQHRQGHRREDGAVCDHLLDSKSHLVDDERVPLLILTFAANLWEVRTISSLCAELKYEIGNNLPCTELIV